jgi:hypothetical protein
MNKKLAIVLIAFAAASQSCKKETEEVVDNTAASALFGDWKFLKMSASVVSEASIADAGINYRIVNSTNYSTTNASGVLRFGNDKANTIDLSYNVSGTLEYWLYENGVKDDDATMSFPFSYNLPKAASESSYKAVGSDSLYFPAGGLLTMPAAAGSNGGTTTVPTMASGYKYKIKKGTATDTLVLVMKGVYQQNTSVEGISTKSTNAVNASMTFTKK